jgi:hypothetical protein
MALPTLDATFASAADQPRRMILAKWLVEEIGSTAQTSEPSNATVSGANSETCNGQNNPINGLYVYDSDFAGYPSYKQDLGGGYANIIRVATFEESDGWQIATCEDTSLFGSGINSFFAFGLTNYPWQASFSAINGSGSVIITESAPVVTNEAQVADYYDLPERYLWAKIAVAAGAPQTEADYISLPKNYAWKAIYNAVSGSSAGTTDWSEKQALGHIAAAYRGDTGNPENLATYIDWPWRYQVASIITSL